MAQYKCTKSFQSINNGYFGYGQKIGRNEYSGLSYSEQRNFTEESDIVDDIILGAASTIIDSISDLGSSASSDSSSSLSSESFGGGGDFGGGGASGDW